MQSTPEPCCCCGIDDLDLDLELSERTPEQEIQFLKTFLTTLTAKIDDAVVQQEKRSSGDQQQAIDATRMQVKTLVDAMVNYHAGGPGTVTETLAANPPMGDPTSCYNAYYACLARQGTNCVQQLQICLGG